MGRTAKSRVESTIRVVDGSMPRQVNKDGQWQPAARKRMGGGGGGVWERGGIVDGMEERRRNRNRLWWWASGKV
jgi:hypothetical protein